MYVCTLGFGIIFVLCNLPSIPLPYILLSFSYGMYATNWVMCGTAQRQLDTRTHAAAWKFSDKDLNCALNIWTGTRYVCACIRLIIGHVYPQALHSFLNNKFYWHLILIVYTGCTYESILELTVLLKNCSRTVACSILCPIVWYGEWILYWRLNLLNLFAFGLSVEWKPVRKYASY